MMEGIELPNQGKIRTPGEKATYKYSGILEAVNIRYAKMKEKRKNKTSREQMLMLGVWYDIEKSTGGLKETGYHSIPRS